MFETDSIDNLPIVRAVAPAWMPEPDTCAVTETVAQPDFHEGIEPAALQPGGGSTVLTLLMVGVLFVGAVNAQGVTRALKKFKSELLTVRNRPNVFDDETSVPLPLGILFALIFIIFGGITLYNFPERPAAPSLAGVAASMGLVGAYCLFQICAYGMVGYVFADDEQNKRWLGGFYATQALAGLGMAAPAIVAVTCPPLCDAMTIISLSAYAIAHLLFIIKGFRIFFHEIGSLLYFILYLCTLEIIPIVCLYRISMFVADTVG